MTDLVELVKREGFEINDRDKKNLKIIAYDQEFPLVHPAAVRLKLYRDTENVDLKCTHLIRAHHLLWPSQVATWNYWSEERFHAHCEGWNCITYAAGAGAGKSHDAAKIACLFWLCNPKKRAVLVMSTTLESLNSRIYGYVTRFLGAIEAQSGIKFPFVIRGGNNPKVLNIKEKGKGNDDLHSISAVAAKKGDSDTAISSLIGRHPEEGLMVVADECTDLPVAIMDAVPNLSSGGLTFQLVGIGNSNSKFDLHGALSTPKEGWKHIDPMKVNKWETTQKNGVCLYFNPYNSPAIHETDEGKKEKLSKFLVTTEKIEEKKKEYGEKSGSFARFVLGYWRDDAEDSVVISSRFLSEFNYDRNAEWSGLKGLNIVGGLDPAFSSGGDICILQLGVLGVDVRGRTLLDFRGNELQFKIDISRYAKESAEIQVATKVVEIINKYGCSLRDVCIDATGQGRALGELIRLQGKMTHSPLKIFCVGQGGANKRSNSFDMLIRTPLDLWQAVKDFIQTDQLRGINRMAAMQFTSRLIVINETTRKQVLENKQAFKRRMAAIMPVLGKSPDEADAISLCLQAAINNYGFSASSIEKQVREPTLIMEKIRVFQEARNIQIEEQRKYGPDLNSNFGGSLEDTAMIKLPFT